MCSGRSGTSGQGPWVDVLGLSETEPRVPHYPAQPRPPAQGLVCHLLGPCGHSDLGLVESLNIKKERSKFNG